MHFFLIDCSSIPDSDPFLCFPVSSGTGSEIGNRAPESLSEDSWTGAAQLTIPQVIEDIHTDYLQCGAQILTTNTYASNRHCLDGDGVGARAVEACEIACALAKRACERATKDSPKSTFIMGSISTHPPNFKTAVAAAAKSSEDAPGGNDSKVNATGLSLWPAEEVEMANFQEQADALNKGGVDAIVLEMVKDLFHGRFVLQAAMTTGLPVVCGITVKIGDDNQVYLRDDPVLLVDAVNQYLEICPNIVCINIMHSPAEFIAPGLDAVRTVWHGTIGCYPNNGTAASWPEWTEGDLMPEDLVKFASGWAAQGATLIGGCCGIGPAHIRALAEHFGTSSMIASL